VIRVMAWRNLWRHKRRTLLTASSMAASVAVCIAMSGITAGFLEAMRVAVVDRQVGHVQVHDPDYPTTLAPSDTVADASAVLDRLRASDGVTAAAPRVHAFGMFAAGKHTATGSLLGVDPRSEAALSAMDDRVTVGGWLDDEDAVVVGYRLARDLRVQVGDSVRILSRSASGFPRQVSLPVAGIYRTTNLALDDGAVVPLAVAQDLLRLQDAIHEIVVLTDDPDTIDARLPALARAAGPSALVRPWWDIAPDVVSMLAMQGATVGLFALVIIGIAAFIIINTLLMSVYERTRELGILAAVGTRPGQIVGLVLSESFLLAVLSGLLGLAGGLLADLYLAKVGLNLAVAEGEGFQLGGVVLDPRIHAVVTADTVLIPLGALFLVGVVGGLWPALHAARLDPITAIRSE